MAEENEPSTRVTLGAVYNLVLEVKEVVSPLPHQVNDHEIRIRAIEKYLWIWIGASGVLGAGIGQIINSLVSP
jgi:hypothetical protein